MALQLPPAPVSRAALEALRAELGPSFAGEAQRRFFDSRAQELLYSGAMGAGKSRVLCEKAWHLALRYPGITVGVFRKVRASLAATTLRTFTRDVMQPGRVASRNLSEGWWELDNGSRIYFLGLDPDPITGVPSKIGSLELAWAGVDEAVEVSEGDWTMLLGRLRDPRIPWHQLAAATNPGPPAHWLKLRFTPPTADREYLHATAADNRFLPEQYRRLIAALPDNAIGRRLGKGEWASVEGAIWTLEPEFIRAVEGEPRRVVAGLDWGFVHQFAVEVVGQSGSGRLSVRGELYVQGLGLDQLVEPFLHPQTRQPHEGLARLLERHRVGTLAYDPSEPQLAGQLLRLLEAHRSSHSQELAAAGQGHCQLRVELKPATNTMSTGLQAVDKALRQGMTVDPGCRGLIAELPGYTWAPDKKGGFHERPVEVGDDACDALRYAVMEFEPDPENPWAALAGGPAGGVA